MLKKTLFNFVFHVVLIIASYFLLFNLQIWSVLPDKDNLLNWDAAYHYSIMTEGYEYIAFVGCNLAFFPMFPLIWKVSSLSPVGISILNVVLFILALGWLLKKEQVSAVMQLLIISIPSFIFFALPYSEAVFFLFATLIIIGYRSNNHWLRNIGFLGASMTKSVSVLFIPAIILSEYMGAKRELTEEHKGNGMIWSCLSSFAGLLIAACIQGLQTGKWFYFLEMQQYWGRHWIIPEIPLYTPVAYDAISFVMGLIAVYLCGKAFYSAVMKQNSNNICLPDKNVIFCLLYLAATTILDTCFTYNNGGANIWSINRHFFCTPFVVIMLIWLVRDFSPSKAESIFILLLIISGIYITHIYQNPQYILSYVLFFGAFLTMKVAPAHSKYLIAVYLFNAYMQLQYFHGFLSNSWIG